MKTNSCLNCNKDISMDIEFGGNKELICLGPDCDGFVCSKKCYSEYDKKLWIKIEKIAKMSKQEFSNYMLGTE